MARAKTIGEQVESMVGELLRERQADIEEIVSKAQDRKGYIKVSRVKGKIANFTLSTNARGLLHDIEEREASGRPISFVESTGMNWNILRCLLTRSIVTWDAAGRLVVFRGQGVPSDL